MTDTVYRYTHTDAVIRRISSTWVINFNQAIIESYIIIIIIITRPIMILFKWADPV